MSINKTAVKTMDILELFYEHEELSLTEMVQLTSMPKTSVYRLIGSLEEMDFLQKNKKRASIVSESFFYDLVNLFHKDYP